MIKKLINIFRGREHRSCPSEKHSYQPTLDDFVLKDYDVSEILKHIDNLEKLLGIKVPSVIVVPYIYDADGFLIISSMYDPSIPYSAYNYGFYNPDQNKIILSAYEPKNQQNRHVAELLFTALHEIRHIWQDVYHHDIYYAKNAVGKDHLFDQAEIDADAFACAYMKACTNYIPKFYIKQFNNLSLYDNGKRIARSKLIQQKYLS